MTQNQSRKYLEKLGFEDVRIVPEVLEIVVEESHKILEKNAIATQNRAYAWESKAYFETQSSIEECQRVIANREVFVLGFNLVCAFAKIGEEALENIIEDRDLHQEFYLYRPGNALMIYSTEGSWYDKPNAIRAKVFYGQVKTKLGDYLTLPEEWKDVSYGFDPIKGQGQ